MLLLMRKEGQAVRVGDARVVVTRIARGKVTLGFEADASVHIVREELLPDLNADRPRTTPAAA